ncbi:MAG: ABC transporter ATP-binding protein [Clostridia bacterium]
MNIVFNNFNKSYGDEVVYKDFNLEIAEGKITSILGGSGSGKTTLLNAVSGLMGYQGEINGIPNDISYIFQNQILIPNLTVYKNIEYVLYAKIKDKTLRQEKITNALDAVGLLDSIKKYPSELSTGMAQRVSMARAFAYPAPLILMDEPFRGLDIGLKNRLIAAFTALWEKERRTVIFVTHNIDEALLLSERIIVIGNRPVEIISEQNIDIPQSSRRLADMGDMHGKLLNLFS